MCNYITSDVNRDKYDINLFRETRPALCNQCKCLTDLKQDLVIKTCVHASQRLVTE